MAVQLSPVVPGTVVLQFANLASLLLITEAGACLWYDRARLEVAMHAVQMKEHLKGVSSSLVLIDDIHLYVLKAEGPHVQHTRSDAVHASINQVRPDWTHPTMFSSPQS